MKIIVFRFQVLILFVCLIVDADAQSFKATQQKCARVKVAYAEKWDHLKSELTQTGINKDNFEMFIRIFKTEKTVEIWLKPKEQNEYKLFKTYAVCSSSGELGPKRKQGDGQVPEGFYTVSVFNPYSNYYLSLGVSYPNTSDKIIGKGNLGGDIMIHGNCVTIGCVPLTDNYIKEVYVLAVEARNSGQQNIPVHIFPAKLNEQGIKSLTGATSNKALIAFWGNLKTGYDYFEKNKKLPKINTDKMGQYRFD